MRARRRAQVRVAESLAKTTSGRSQAGLLAPGSSFHRAFPTGLHIRPVAFAAVVAGHSGASAADFHGLPFSPAVMRTPVTDVNIPPRRRGCQEEILGFDGKNGRCGSVARGRGGDAHATITSGSRTTARRDCELRVVERRSHAPQCMGLGGYWHAPTQAHALRCVGASRDRYSGRARTYNRFT